MIEDIHTVHVLRCTTTASRYCTAVGSPIGIISDAHEVETVVKKEESRKQKERRKKNEFDDSQLCHVSVRQISSTKMTGCVMGRTDKTAIIRHMFIKHVRQSKPGWTMDDGR